MSRALVRIYIYIYVYSPHSSFATQKQSVHMLAQDFSLFNVGCVVMYVSVCLCVCVGVGTDPLLFDRPTDIVFDKAGFGYVSDGEGDNNRIVVLHPDLTYKFSLGSLGQSNNPNNSRNIPNNLL